jgi:hypothetical protein
MTRHSLDRDRERASEPRDAAAAAQGASLGRGGGAASHVRRAGRRARAARARAVVAAMAAAALAGVASASAPAQPTRASAATHAAPAAAIPTCAVKSLPSFITQGEEANVVAEGRERTAAMVADIIEVECNPKVYGTKSQIKITASQLFNRCEDSVTWYVPNPFREEAGKPGVSVELDADGNATVAVLAGPNCSPGEVLITAHMEQEPFESFTTSFSVLPPETTPEGLLVTPSGQVEDSFSSAVATIVQVELPGASEAKVHIGSEELFHRCRLAPHVHWIMTNGEDRTNVSEVREVEVDNDGNAFVILIGDKSCAPGTSLIEADLESKPFTTLTSSFTVLAPQPTAEPAFTIEKLQEIAGTKTGFTSSPLKGAIGQVVDYEIVVKNTGIVPEQLSGFTDPHCDPGTEAGGPGSSALAPGQATTYTCNHMLTAVGAYTNEATVTATTVGGAPLTKTSNQVLVEVPAMPALAIEKLQKIMGSTSGFTSAQLTAAVGQTVEYKIIVTNSGNVALSLENFTDPHCDAETIAGGPGKAQLAPGATTTYTCRHVLTTVGGYTNVATVTGSAQGQAPLTHESNRVEVNAAAKGAPASAPQGPAAGVAPATPAANRAVLARCEASSPAFRGPAGPKRGTFAVQVKAAGAKQITFYLDGHKVTTLKLSQAKGGRFTIHLDARRLSYGRHTVSVKALFSNRVCVTVARSAVFVRPYPQPLKLKFTG